MLILSLLAAVLSVTFFVAANDVDEHPSQRPGVDGFFQILFCTLGAIMTVCTFVGVVMCFV